MNEFDRYAEQYDLLREKSIRFSGFPPAYFDEFKVRAMHDFLSSQGRADRKLRILNFGCGIGRSEQHLVRHFRQARIFSLDTSPESIARAMRDNAGFPDIVWSVYDGKHIPFDTTFQVIFLAGVLHHISENDRIPALRELGRVLAGDGVIFIFEHNPYNPLTRRAVCSCPYDEDALLLTARAMRRLLRDSGFRVERTRYIHFFPNWLRPLIPAERFLGRLPLGAQYLTIAVPEQPLGMEHGA